MRCPISPNTGCRCQSERSPRCASASSDIRKAGETQVLTPDMRLHLTGALDRAGTAVEQWPLHLLTYPDIAAQLAFGYRAVQRAIPEAGRQRPPTNCTKCASAS